MSFAHYGLWTLKQPRPNRNPPDLPAGRAVAIQAGLQVVVNTAGVPSLLTSAMQYNRLTLTVIGGFVTAARITQETVSDCHDLAVPH